MNRIKTALGRWLWSLIKDAAEDWVDRALGECRHDWTNWSNPVETDAKVPTSPFINWTGEASVATNQTAWVQQRQCIKCNRHERRYC